MRDVLLKRLPFFKMKSISDFMITIGASRSFIAFDIRVVGLLNKHFGLNIKLEKIQSDKTLYKKLEEKLREICSELGIACLIECFLDSIQQSTIFLRFYVLILSEGERILRLEIEPVPSTGRYSSLLNLLRTPLI